MGAKKTRLILISGALVLFVLLYISPRQSESSPPEGVSGPAGLKPQFSGKKEALTPYLNSALDALPPELKNRHETFGSKSLNDSLVRFWDQQRRPDLASFYLETLAEKKDSASFWYKTGNRYYYAVPFVKDESEVPLLYARAQFCFNKSWLKDSSNTDAKIMMAACMVENNADPMKGIALLRSIEKTDSANVKLQMTFALFSVKSGQLDKAVIRFKKVLQIDSTAIDVYLHLADVYEKLNEQDLSLQMLETYQSKTTDPTIKLEIGKYIEQLRKSN